MDVPKLFKPREHLYLLEGVTSQDGYYGMCRTLRKYATKEINVLLPENGQFAQQFFMPRDNIAIQVTRTTDEKHEVFLDYVALSLGKRFFKPDYLMKMLETHKAKNVDSPSTDIKHFKSLDRLINS